MTRLNDHDRADLHRVPTAGVCGSREAGGRSECGEMVSYFHLYLTLSNREPILHELRKRGIIVTNVGPYTNFRDPEGRVIKISDSRTVVG